MEFIKASWLMEFIKDEIDFHQYGGLKGNSITHYIIELLNFILSCQDSNDQTSVLAVLVDFSKAFHRQNHNLLITKLSDIGVPAWLLRVVISFLSDRKMRVKYYPQLDLYQVVDPRGPYWAYSCSLFLSLMWGLKGDNIKRNMKATMRYI